MRHLIALCCCLFGLLSLPALAANSTSVEPLLTELAGAKIKNMVPILVKIEEASDESILPLFHTLLGGDLYYIKATKEIVGKFEVDGKTAYKDVFTDQLNPSLSKKDVKKIRVNNKLRGYLRNAIARIQLTAKSPTVRENAVRELLSKLDDNTVSILEDLYPKEPNEKVKDAMGLALSMNTASQTQLGVSSRLTAIEILSTSLENDVRNLLTQPI